MKPRRNQVLGRTLFALLLATIVGFALIAATVWASQNSLPDGTFYGVKRLSEDTQRLFASAKLQRAELELKFVARRLDELERCTSGICRLEAAVGLDAALTRAALAVALVPSDEREVLEAEVTDLAGEGAAWLEEKVDKIFKTALSQRLRTPALTSQPNSDADTVGNRLKDVIVELGAVTQVEAAPEVEKSPVQSPPIRSQGHPFPRDGAHAKASCEDCHAAGVYQGTPRECAACHEDPHQGAKGLTCQSCHTVDSFRQAQVDHTELVECSSCHSETAPPNHFASQCSQCHVAGESWSAVQFDHAGLADCRSCHGETAPAGHFSAQCSQCHTSNGRWADVRFKHDGFTDCQSCHTRPDGHFSGQCSPQCQP
jgi:hypothetical protein